MQQQAGESFDMVLSRDPSLFYKIPVHPAGKGNRTTETERSEPEEIQEQLCERTWLLEGTIF